MDLNLTTFLAIWGAIISTILFIIRLFEWRAKRTELSEKRKKLKVVIDFTEIDNSINGYPISGRYGDQYISISVTNVSSNVNTLINLYFEGIGGWFSLNRKSEIIKLNSTNEKNVEFISRKIETTEYVSYHYLLNLDILEFHKDRGCNINRFEEMERNKKFFRAVAIDSFQNKYYSKRMKIKDLIVEFYKKEKRLTTEQYRKDYYTTFSVGLT